MRIYRKYWWRIAIIAAISQVILFTILETLIDTTNIAHIIAVVISFISGGLVVGAMVIVTHKRSDTLTVYKITKNSDEYAEYEEVEEITPIK